MKKYKLMKSISGIRGVIGKSLDPVTITTYGAAFGSYLKRGKVVIGSDTRPSGEMVRRAVTSGLMAVGRDVIDIGIVPTPTVEIAVKDLKATGGICVTASHNPASWNALKFFNASGEFLTLAQYQQMNRIFESGRFAYQPVEKLGSLSHDPSWVDKHIKKTLAVKTINRRAVKRARFTVVVDAINGAGSEALPELLERLGAKVHRINCKGDGNFVHEAEPLPKNLGQLARAVKRHKADLGLACDPDCDRLVLIDERGRPVHEELTLTIAVYQVLRKRHGPTVINLSTSRTTADIAKALGSRVWFSKVGEANVVEMMNKKGGVIGGEGNGGVIYPEFHAGRDALIGAALVLSALAETKRTLSQLLETFPRYYNIKAKATLPDDFDRRLARFEKQAADLLGRSKVDRRDGLRFDFEAGWLQLRKSNTEPIFRLIVETNDAKLTEQLRRKVIKFFK
ncbi:MAG: phosphoglucosamine mutase [candidate division Zixibacteria bacterium]|nr:phosphoglucosamine mutase [candidate division Zixibacteria bacterium]